MPDAQRNADAAETFFAQPPKVELPKGGGAIRGIGEKFGANPVTGTGAFTVPLAVSPGRSGFGPRLSLSYDSGAGNGPFGLGWSLGLPAITRKTDKGLPRYDDEGESDMFLLSGSEDLVPVLEIGSGGQWTRKSPVTRTLHGEIFETYEYRPRIEGLFARIERWVRKRDGDTHWRSVSRDNVTTWYGATPPSRVYDPADPHRVFSWLLCESFDDKGNVVQYEYAAEDSSHVDTSQVNERNRTPLTRTASRYIKRIKYGNRTSRVVDPVNYAAGGWLFEIVFDYEDGHYAPATVSDPERDYISAWANPAVPVAWSARPDPFSTYRPGFEVRTYRLCRHVLMFHHFDELGATPCLVRSTEITYETGPVTSFITAIGHCGYVRQKDTTGNYVDIYLKSSLPPLQLTYSKVVEPEAIAALPLGAIDATSLENLPYGLAGDGYRWIDLDGEGVSGILFRQPGAWYYKENLGDARFAQVAAVTRVPALAAVQGPPAQLLDLAGDGQLDLATFGLPVPGFYERTADATWDAFRTFDRLPNVDWRDPNLKFIDLTGDGHADLVISEDEAFIWHESLAEDGFGPGQRVAKAPDEEQGPRIVFADPSGSIFLADMSGDGLTDLVRIRPGDVCYWPNLGYGRFGTKVTVDASPWFGEPDQFDPRRIRLADIDGSGTTDIIYFGRDGARLYFNRSGNSFSQPVPVPQFPRSDDLSSLDVVDLFGSGTACLVHSSFLPGDLGRQVQYIDLMAGQKPHLLVKTANNMGAGTEVQYTPSTTFYLRDKRDGTPWVTRLPFPVHCVERVTVTDKWRGTRFVTTYDYHHGYYDGIEREFRGFGRVGRLDIESYGRFAAANTASPYVTADRTLYQPPVRTVTWYHTGNSSNPEKILTQLEHEYFPAWFEEADPAVTNVLGTFQEKPLPEPDLGADPLSDAEWREALRACKGLVLRQEICELDVDALERGEHKPVKLFSTADHSYAIHRLQPLGGKTHAVFLITESESLTYNYELDLTQPTLTRDPRVAHTLNLRVDEHGNVLQVVTAVYPRIGSHVDPLLPASALNVIDDVQRERHVLYAESRFTDDVVGPDDHRLRVACEARMYDVTGVEPKSGQYFSIDELRHLDLSDFYAPALPATPVFDIPYEQVPSGSIRQRRIVEHARTLFYAEDLINPLAFGTVGRLGLMYETYKLALTESLLQSVFGAKLTGAASARLSKASVSGYLSGSTLAARFVGVDTTGQFWIPSGTAGFAPGAELRFYLPDRYTDGFGNVTTLAYDSKYILYLESTTDAAGSTASVLADRTGSTAPHFDFRVLAPRALKDINDNITEAYFDGVGLTVAVALEGKGLEGDLLSGYDDALANPSLKNLESFFTGAYDETEARRLLGNATTRYVYYMGQARDAQGKVAWGTHAPCACAITRERHVADLEVGEESPIQTAFECSDGLGAVIVKKVQAEPEPGNADLRWIATGKTILNNKGKAVRQYEPYFSPGGHLCEEPAEAGVTPLLYYDAAGRLIRTEMPDGTFSRVEFSPWHVTAFDGNDTVLESHWYAQRGSPTPTGPEPTDPRVRAAWLTAAHANTPAVTILDSLGRDVIAIADNRRVDSSGLLRDEKYLTQTKLDSEGKPLWIRDARGNLVMQYITPAKRDSDPGDAMPAGSVPCYDVAGNLLFQHSMDAGNRWLLNDAAGTPLLGWDANTRQDDATGQMVVEDREFLTEYDVLHRPVTRWLTVNGSAPALVERFVYGEGIPGDRARNLRGQLHQHYDPAGRNTVEAVHFNGKPLEIQRTLTSQYRSAVVDWNAAPGTFLENETFIQDTEYDALGRVTRLYNWHTAQGRVAVYVPSYNKRGLLVSETLEVGATKTAAGHTLSGRPITAPIRELRYNAKGQKEYLLLGNDTLTQYDYDPETFRLTQIRTTRPGDASGFPPRRANLQDPGIVQQLLYTFDPVGNITEIEDQAYEPVFFKNQRVEPRGRYVYDALYRLTGATGRENAQATTPPDQFEPPPFVVQFPVTSQALRNYSQTYRYDAVGNIEQMRHAVGTAGQGAWTRNYEYHPDSNRLKRTWDGNNQLQAVSYQYDLHGSMLNLQNVGAASYLRWDYRDMIRALDLGGGGWAYHNCDADKQRTRKVITDQQGNKQWERLYLGGLEIYRRYVAGTVIEEIESLHLFEGEQRVLLVDDILTTTGLSRPRRVYRYQYTNHLGSACIELDGEAVIISYEEHHLYGTTAYRAVNASVEAPPKRYRYIGVERDEESGLAYHTARYYAPWLARWGSCDPSGLVAGTNRYMYANGNPIRLVDMDGRAPAIPSVQQNAFSAAGSGARLLTNHELEAGFVPKGTSRQMMALVGPQIAAPIDLDPATVRLQPINREVGAAGARERGPVLEDASRIEFEQFVNNIGPFSPGQNKMMNEALAMPVLATSAPTVAVALGSYATVMGYDALFHGDYDLAKGRLLVGVGLLGAAKAPSEYRVARNAYANVGPLQDRLKAAVIGDRGYLNKQVTISVGVGRTEVGAPVTMVSVNEGAGGQITTQVRELAAREGAVFVQGTGHAEQNIYTYARQQGLRELMVDASIPHCGVCTSEGLQAGAQLRNSTRGQYWYRGEKYSINRYPSPPASVALDPSANDWLSRHPDIPWE